MKQLIDSTEEHNRKLVFNFPYEELLNINGVDLAQIRQCLPYLLKISKIDLFYTNFKSLKITLEFVISNLSIFDDVCAKDIFIGLLTLLNEIVVRLGIHKKLENVFPSIGKFLDNLLYISDLNIFGINCAKICEPILLEVLKLIKNDFTSIDTSLAGILENFKEIKAKREVARISEMILGRFPLNSSSYILSAYWLMEDSIQVLKDLEMRNIQEEVEEETIAIVMRTIQTFYKKIGKSVRRDHAEATKYEMYLDAFRKELLKFSPKLIRLCCIRKLKEEARILLAAILYEFLTEQGIMSCDVDSLMEQEICEFPMNMKEWPKKFTRTFFWICYLLYANKSYVWPSADILLAIHRLIYTKKHTKQMNVSILKAVCYIYPFAIQGCCYNHKRESLGDDILNIIHSSFLSRIDNFLSLETSQIIWIMQRGSYKLKTATLQFWLNKCSNEQINILEESLKASRSEEIIIDIIVNSRTSQGLVLSRAVTLISCINSTTLIKTIQRTIPKCTEEIKLFETLMKASAYKVPQDKNISINLLKSICCTITLISDDTVLINLCCYTRKLLTSLNTDKQAIQFICNNKSIIRFLIIRLRDNNEELSIEVLGLLRKFLKYQLHRKGDGHNQDEVTINLIPLMQGSSVVVEKAIALLCEILNSNTFFTLPEANILETVYKLCDLTSISSLSEKCYICLSRLLKLYLPSLKDLPFLGMLVEDMCFYSSRKNVSLVEVKFVLFWINMMFTNPNRSFCFLPELEVVKKYILRNVTVPITVKKNLYFISKIYQIEKPSGDEQIATIS